MILLHTAYRLSHLLHAQPVLPAKGALKLLEHGCGFADLLLVAAETDFIVSCHQLYAEAVPDHPQIAVGRAKQGKFLFRLFQCDVQLHIRLFAPGWFIGGENSGAIIPTVFSHGRPQKARGAAQLNRTQQQKWAKNDVWPPGLPGAFR